MTDFSVKPQVTQLLAKAVEACNLNDIRLFANAGGDVNGRPDPRQPPFLHHALVSRKYDVAELLLSLGADPETRGNESGWRAAHYAAHSGGGYAVHLLSQNGCDLNAPDIDGCTPLHIAALCGNKAAAETLLSAGADITLRNKTGQSAPELARIRADNEFSFDRQIFIDTALYLVEQASERSRMMRAEERQEESAARTRTVLNRMSRRGKWHL